MPVYEFYCGDCHRLFNFLSRRVDTEKRPRCPRCGRPGLERQVSLFSISKGRKEDARDAGPDLDDARLEQAMEALAGEAEGLEDKDPRQVAQLLRRLYQASGMPLGSGVEEAIRRMEAGEDPEEVEAELGDLLDAEDPFATADAVKGMRRKLLPPSRDDTLYEL